MAFRVQLGQLGDPAQVARERAREVGRVVAVDGHASTPLDELDDRMLLPRGDHAGADVRCRADLERDGLGHEMLDQCRVLHRADTVAYTVHTQVSQRRPHVLGSGGFARMCRATQSRLGRAAVDRGVAGWRVGRLRTADGDAYDAGRSGDLDDFLERARTPCGTGIAHEVDQQVHAGARDPVEPATHGGGDLGHGQFVPAEVGRRDRGLGIDDVLLRERGRHGRGHGGPVIGRADEGQHPLPGLDEVGEVAVLEAGGHGLERGRVRIAVGLHQRPQGSGRDGTLEVQVQLHLRCEVEDVGHRRTVAPHRLRDIGGRLSGVTLTAVSRRCTAAALAWASALWPAAAFAQEPTPAPTAVASPGVDVTFAPPVTSPEGVAGRSV